MIIRFLLKTLRPFKALIFGQITAAIFVAIDLSLRPYILKLIFDQLPKIQVLDVNHKILPLITCTFGMLRLVGFWVMKQRRMKYE